MSKTTTARNTTDFGSLRAACKKAGLTAHQVMKLAAAGRVRTLALPGTSLKYSLTDAEKIGRDGN